MIVTYNWLKQYMDLSDVTPEALAEAITRGGLEVEGYEKQAFATKLVIGEVKECIAHPDSDHLHICQVNTGKDVRQIVCGAPNVRTGLKVIVAMPGCQLKGGDIKEGVIRGQESKGMLCSLAELNVDKKSLTEKQLSGIEELPDDAVVGNEDVLGYLGLNDTIYDVSLTPNRADCLSMWAIAKDIGAILDKKVALPEVKYECKNEKANLKIVSETEKCPYFLGRVINHVTIKPSPLWLKQALNSAGVKSINNVVDISNLVMLETGQPLHFYDLSKIPAREITVKTGLDEMYTALDGNEYHVLKDDIMITTEGKAIGYAGIMGGDDSKIEEDTKGIIIEAASFNLVNIRNTSRRLDLITEAASRFSKGIDPKAAEKAVERSVQLLIEFADADGIEETVVCGDNGYKDIQVDAPVDQINRLLGTQFTYQQINNVFERLDFKPEKMDDNTIRCNIPSYRTDVRIWQDLSEEVIRILGYDNIVSTLPKMPTTQARYAKYGKERRVIQGILNGFGFNEIATYSLVSQAKLDEGLMNIGTAVRIDNAFGEDRRYYRTSILPSAMDIIAYNEARGNDEYALFEMAKVYDNDDHENMHLSLAMSDKVTHSKWQNVADHNDFYTLKGIILSILDKLGFDEKRISFKPMTIGKEVLHPNKSAEIYLGKNLLGVCGSIHPLEKKKYNIAECVLAELNLDVILNEKSSRVKYVAASKYPNIAYDLALLVKDEITAEQIVTTIRKAGGSLCESVEIFDVYKGANIEEGYKSVAVSVSYRSAEKTLTEKDVAPVHAQVLDQLSVKLHASLRD